MFAQQLLLTSMAFGLQLLFPIITLRILDLFGHSRGAATSAHTFFLLVLAALMMGALAPVAVAVDATPGADRIHFQFRRLVRMASGALVPTALPGGTFLKAAVPVAGRSGA